ncbi:cytochrome c [Sulfitobacter sp. D35]|uniref:cytochrome c n=1 Tax=Sulfitobacter sp. D35 TaxID=3083252 RepID=UPI00296F589C|nr:cytochrome c [Sulfitobacter sp. D35]MDW4497778.1 cytochrome c [Sulfitobacter sp. D35]
MKTIGGLILAAALVAAGVGWVLTWPASLPEGYAAGHAPDPENGAQIFAAGGCASCHAAPDAEEDAEVVLAGGLAFPSDFGTFYAPNISPDAVAGIGAWSFEDFARALTRGVSPQGAHYYPAFPYTAYAHAAPEDVADLWAYLQTLPASDTASKSHDVGFPFSIRRGLGLWKTLYMDDDYVLAGDLTEAEERGRYIAEALAHCGECHTPRNALGGLDRTRWLGGAPNPSGKGRIPNITPGALDWSESDLVYYFTSGFTPEYDTAGGEMAAVVRNLAQLPESDRQALAAYVLKLPAVSPDSAD